jgi:LmbE family N-acetylglucosaminyl deacetylase
MVSDSFDKIFSGKKRVMVVLAHPDDAEVAAGGTIARLTKSGVRVRVVKMTSGNRGSRQTSYKPGQLEGARALQQSKLPVLVLYI